MDRQERLLEIFFPAGSNLLEAEVYGDGIKMWLLSQGAWVKVVRPEEFVGEMREEIEKIKSYYDH